MKISKHQEYRRNVKARAVAMMGGCCSRCGFDDARALRFHHTKPIRRGLNGLRRQSKTSTTTHLAVVRGDKDGVRLLCSNCSTIETAKDWTLNINVKRRQRDRSLIDRPRR